MTFFKRTFGTGSNDEECQVDKPRHPLPMRARLCQLLTVASFPLRKRQICRSELHQARAGASLGSLSLGSASQKQRYGQEAGGGLRTAMEGKSLPRLQERLKDLDATSPSLL